MKDVNVVLKEKEAECEAVRMQVFVLLSAIHLLAEPGEPGFDGKEVHETQHEVGA